MIAWADYAIGDTRINCLVCDGRKTLGITIDPDGHGVGHCFKCSYAVSRRSDRGSIHHTVRTKPKAKPQRGMGDWGNSLWKSCKPLSGIATQYLESRHCVVPLSGDLRWHPALKHPSGYIGPALVALITDVVTNASLSLHRTWITATGKADIENPRLLLANHAIDGGCIRLTPNDDVGGILGIAEGIETALSLAHAPLPVWSMIDANHLSRFPVLQGIKSLVIAQDQDPAGIKAARTCAMRWAAADKEVLVTQQAKNDLNDTLREVTH